MGLFEQQPDKPSSSKAIPNATSTTTGQENQAPPIFAVSTARRTGEV